jgi:hypothetical protein
MVTKEQNTEQGKETHLSSEKKKFRERYKKKEQANASIVERTELDLSSLI